jgi:type II secretion system protein I
MSGYRIGYIEICRSAAPQLKMRRRCLSTSTSRRGLSLLEVMLALAILGGALAAIGELMRIGARNAEIARDLTTAQLICESTIAELQLGFIPMQSVGPIQVTDLQYQQEWLYSIKVEPIDQDGLSSVWVGIEQNPEIFSRPVSFAATRWMVDPAQLETGASDE